MGNFWDERYSSNECVYGREPNEFFRTELKDESPGKILLVGEGEGRNAVFAAKNGWQVEAYDFSEIARKKALKFAEEEGVKIAYTVEDLAVFSPPEEYFDAAAIIYVHLSEELREDVHKKIISSLKPGGKLILEVFEKEQLKYGTGGPKNINMLYSLEDVYSDFHDLDIIKFSKDIIDLNEGAHHKGRAAVIRYVGVKPL